MRILLGWLLLLSAFAGAGVLQHRWSAGLRREQAQRAETRAKRPSLAPTGRAQLVLGRPSGSEPVEVARSLPGNPLSPAALAERRAPAGTSASDTTGEPVPSLTLGASPETAADWPEGEAPPSWTPPVYELRVPTGAVLSKICEDFYGSGRPPIPARVAEYNGLRSPDHVRAGDRLQLPPLEELGIEP